ncbi:olfactory receptor 146-like [Oryzias melastigma]|uniref:olfactory receptor 146-like n=1 Tax=Oryzias melastigma TaxID=30732 RepID=UPI00168D5FCF|nr:olfactory receptor 146-like [Oryzias melastigma]
MVEEKRARVVLNITFFRPEKFYISGFYNIPYTQYFYVFLCFVYVMTVIGNVFLLSVICLVRTLHSPKYMIVFNLALTDLCGSTALIPKLLDTFLFERRYILYEACLSYMFFVMFFGSLQSWTLVCMAYDRFVAICFPLRYHSIVSKRSVAVILLFMWLALITLWSSTVGLLNRLSFCGSLEVQSFYCDHGPIFRLACNDNSINNIMAYAAFLLVLCIPIILIAITYACISIALSRIASTAERLKALKMCSSHIILAATFFIPLVITNVSAITSNLQPNTRIINSCLAHTIPALLNPIVYSFKTEEVLNAIKKLFRRNQIEFQNGKRKVLRR